MLTIREPIRLKTGRPIQGIRQDMAARIEANYGLMNLAIRKEELLHITSQPAEIYFADSENFQILTNINSKNKQEVRLEVINNLMNRILVAQTENFTYQDIVYISNVLRKLGIRDEKTFMKQVFELQNEHKETKQLLQSYEKNQEVLKQLIRSEAEPSNPEIREQQTITEQERRYYIHDEIFKRLETGKIYQDMRQFSKTYLHESLEINPGEMQMAEQTRLAQNFLLQNIKNEVTGKTTPLQYVHNNRYEYLQEITDEMTVEMEEQISAAVLLNLAEQSYMLRQNQVEENNHYWYSIARSLFETSENTWKRYEANLMERRQYSTQMIQMLEEVNQAKHQEGDMISTIVEEYHQNIQQWNERNEIRQNLLMQKNVLEDKSQEINISEGSYYMTQDELELTLRKEEEEEAVEETQITVEQLQKQLEIYNQKNYENYRKITEIERQQKNIKDRKVNRRRARMDALRALEDPGEVLMEYLTSENKDPVVEMREKTQTQIYELFSEETKEIYRQFLARNTSENHAFLEHIMARPEELKLPERELIEKEIKRQQEELTVVNTVVQKEVRRQQVELVHKVEEQLLNEELLEEIRQQNQKSIKTEQTEETTIQNKAEVHQVVQDYINRVQTNRVEDIEEIVQQSVKRQLSNLSEQVYGKLEKKLQTERKRRGYF